MEGYKLNSGDLFIAFKEAGGEMEDFKGALEELTQENKIQSDNDGNIMTVEDYQREKSQNSESGSEKDSAKENAENIEEKSNESIEEKNEEKKASEESA